VGERNRAVDVIQMGLGSLLFARRTIRLDGWRNHMNLATWLPAMFVLGIASMGLCYAFLKACERI
jgi:hypothetical protein